VCLCKNLSFSIICYRHFSPCSIWYSNYVGLYIYHAYTWHSGYWLNISDLRLFTIGCICCSCAYYIYMYICAQYVPCMSITYTQEIRYIGLVCSRFWATRVFQKLDFIRPVFIVLSADPLLIYFSHFVLLCSVEIILSEASVQEKICQ